MTDVTTGEADRKSRARDEQLPHADPIAYLGTERHPLSVPPTTHDVEQPIHADVLPRSRWVRRVLTTALGAALVLPIAASFSSDESTAPPLQSKPTAESPPIEAAQPAALAVPQDLPPGGLSESATTASTASEERNVADWTDAKQPRDGSGIVTGAVPRDGSGVAMASRVEGASDEATPRDQPQKAAAARVVSAPRPLVAARHFDPRPGVPTTLDFAAAMGAVASMNIGPKQCGLAAVGAVPVAVTFAPSGKAVRAVIEDGALRGTTTGSCVALRLRNVRIEPFEGDAATVRTTISLR